MPCLISPLNSHKNNNLHLYIIQTGREQITQADITTTVRALSLVALQDLYEQLGLEPHEVEKAEENAGTKHTNLRAKSVLRLWLSRNGSDATRIKILLGLKKADHKKPMEVLCAKWNINKELLD